MDDRRYHPPVLPRTEVRGPKQLKIDQKAMEKEIEAATVAMAGAPRGKSPATGASSTAGEDTW